jgi:hypothetical protein
MAGRRHIIVVKDLIQWQTSYVARELEKKNVHEVAFHDAR